MVCFPDIKPGGVDGAAHRMRPCGQAHRDLRRRTWYAFLTTGPAELAARHIDCVPANRQGRKRLASPQTSQGLLSGKHAMPVREKTKGPVCRDANDLRAANTTGPAVGEACDACARKERRAGLQGRNQLAFPQTPQGLLSGVACDARARKDRRACWQGRKRLAATQTPQGLLSGKQAMPVPEKTEGPVSSDVNDLRLRKHRRACCWGSMRCPSPKRPKGRLAGMQMTSVSANTAGPVVGEACDARARKV